MNFFKSLIALVLLTSCLNTFAQQRFNVVIDEIMADPSPQVGLPNVEYIELKNVSSQSINLQGWRLTTNTASSNPFPSYALAPDSFVIIGSSNAATQLASFGKTLAVTNFPSLNNEGSLLNLLSKDGKLIHFVNYSEAWYANEVKKDGGWSLEMIDVKQPCVGGPNWKASINNLGGTPGQINSVAGITHDTEALELKNVFAKDKTTITLIFDEPLDSNNAVLTTNFSIQPTIAIISAKLPQQDFTQLELALATSIDSNTTYTITINSVQDCAGNKTSSTKMFGLSSEPTANDIVINEILFNSRPDEYDYVELYNRSTKIIDVSKLYLGNRGNNGSVGSLKQLQSQPLLFFPNDYIVITEDKSSLLKSYFSKNPDAIIQIPSMPSYPDDRGTVVLQSLQGIVIDELTYTKDWQFALISNDEGVALERIDPDLSTNNKDNWHSAASTVGYGTPTYKNSQYKQVDAINATIEPVPKIFSPDGDGYEDFMHLHYQVSETGFVANVYVFDAAGKMVRHLAKNTTLGLKGSWQWDGLDENRRQLPTGNYIIYTELFTLNSKKKQFKNAVVLARKLR